MIGINTIYYLPEIDRSNVKDFSSPTDNSTPVTNSTPTNTLLGHQSEDSRTRIATNESSESDPQRQESMGLKRLAIQKHTDIQIQHKRLSIRDKSAIHPSFDSPTAIIPSIKLSGLFSSPNTAMIGFSSTEFDNEKSSFTSQQHDNNDYEKTLKSSRSQSNDRAKKMSLMPSSSSNSNNGNSNNIISSSALSWQLFITHMDELQSSYSKKKHELEVEKTIIEESRMAIITEHAR